MRTTSTLLLLPIPFALFAQSPYRPFPENNAGWVEDHGWMIGSGSGFNTIGCSRTIIFGTDTTISGTPYHRLRVRGQCDEYQIFPWMLVGSYAEPWTDLHYFRQDVAERKVYAWDIWAQQEVVWYDFTLGLGPYTPTYENEVYTNDELQVVALDSMELNDGWHRTWVLGLVYDGVQQDSAFCTVIEGVGSTYGVNPVYGLIPPFEWSDFLFCHSVDDIAVYPLGTTACDLTMGVTSVAGRPEHLHAYPNPAVDAINISGDLPSGARATVHDQLGSLVHTGTLLDRSIQCAAWPTGLYHIAVQDASGNTVGVMRVMKE